MRLLLTILIAVFVSNTASAASTPEMPELLSYGQIMMLSQDKRIAYLHEIAEILVLMEKQQAKYEVASSNLDEMREQVATLMQMAALMPQASAENASTATTVTTVWNDQAKSFECLPASLAYFNSSLGACVMKIDTTESTGLKRPEDCDSSFGHLVTISHGFSYSYFCVPNDTFKQLPKSRQAALDSGKTLPEGAFKDVTKEEASKLVLATPPPPPERASAGPDGAKGVPPHDNAGEGPLHTPGPHDKVAGSPHPVASATKVSCAAPAAVACPAGAPGQAAIDAFKNSQANGDCISGGFFGTYEGGHYARGKCTRAKSFPSANSPFKCGTNEYLCNPVLFCYGIEFDRPAVAAKKGVEAKPAGKGFFPRPVCAKLSQTFTESCDTKLQDRIGKVLTGGDWEPSRKFPEFKKSNAPHTARACDPAKDFAGLPQDFQNSYTELVKKTQDKYYKLCVDGTPFKGMFCAECNTIVKHIAKAGCDAGAPAVTAPTPISVPGTVPADGLREKPQLKVDPTQGQDI